MDLLKLADALAALAQGGLIAVALAFLLEHVDTFQKLTPKQKFWGVLAIFIIIPMLAQGVLLYVPAEYIAALDPFWRAALLGIAAWVSSQVAHEWDKDNGG